MAEGRRDRVQKSNRTGDRWIALLIVVLAAVGGVLAGRSGTPRSWERPAPGTPGGEPVHVQGSP
jgi:hypothetical protein